MAAGTIITFLSNIPWGQVVEDAPKVADGAARLWNAVTRKKPGQSSDANSKAGIDVAPSETEVLMKRLEAMEEQMRASVELIKSLAEQNTQLVRKIELNSVRLHRLATATAITAVVLLGAIVYLLLRA